MGHIHGNVQTKVGDSVVLYPGATEHYNFGECGKKTGFCFVELGVDTVDVEFVSTEAQPMAQVKLHTSGMDPKNPTAAAIDAVQGNSHPDGLLQLVLEGETPFESYTQIDFPLIFDRGSRGNFYFEYVDAIRPIVKGMEFKPSEGLNPRRELEAMARKAMGDSEGRDREIWEQASEYALGYYQRSRDE